MVVAVNWRGPLERDLREGKRRKVSAQDGKEEEGEGEAIGEADTWVQAETFRKSMRVLYYCFVHMHMLLFPKDTAPTPFLMGINFESLRKLIWF